MQFFVFPFIISFCFAKLNYIFTHSLTHTLEYIHYIMLTVWKKMSLVNRPLLHNYIIHVSSIALGISHTKKKFIYIYIYEVQIINSFTTLI